MKRCAFYVNDNTYTKLYIIADPFARQQSSNFSAVHSDEKENFMKIENIASGSHHADLLILHVPPSVCLTAMQFSFAGYP